MTLQEYEQQYIDRKDKKTFWAIVMGITGNSQYKKVTDITESDAQEILNFLWKEQSGELGGEVTGTKAGC